MSSTESCKAVREATIAEVLVQEHQLPVARACRIVRLSRTAYYQPPVPASRRDAAVIAALTDAEALRSTAGRRPSLAPQARAPRVLRAAAQFAPTDHSAGAAAHSSAPHGAAGAEPDMGAR